MPNDQLHLGMVHNRRMFYKFFQVHFLSARNLIATWLLTHSILQFGGGSQELFRNKQGSS